MSLWGRGRLWAALGAWLLVSCGGGGGGGGGSEPSVSVTGDRTSLQFVGLGYVPPAAQTIRFTLQNAAGGTYYGLVVPDRPSAFSTTFTPTSSTTAEVTLIPSVPSTPDAYSGAVTFKLCADVNCNRVVWSSTIPYTMTVIGVDTTPVTVAGFEGGAPAVQTIAVTPAGSSSQLVVGASTDSGSGWLSAARGSSGSIEVSTTGNGLAAGSYQGRVTVSLAGQAAGPSLTIPVAFTVGTGIVAPAVAAVDITVDATAASLARQAPVAFNGGQRPAWTASSDQPWLVLTQASGNGAGALGYTVDPAQLSALQNWQSASATVTIHAAGMTDTAFTVTASKQWPELHVASANTVVAGRASQVRVFGRGLLQLPDAARIRVGGAPASGTIVSDTLAVLDLPPLAAGRVPLMVPNAAGVPTIAAVVTAAPAAGLAYATAANAGEKRSALFDPSRNAVYAVNWTQNTLVRYRLVAGQWLVDGLPVADIGDLAMAPDRSTLYVGSGMTTLLAIDPDTLQVTATHQPTTLPGANLLVGRTVTKGMAVTNDLRIWFGNSQWSDATYFDIGRSTFGVATPNGSFLYSPVFFAPADGSRLVVSQNGISPSPPTLLYSAASGTFDTTPALPFVYYAAVWSDDGARVLLDDTALHDGNSGALIGTVQLGSGGINLGSVLSPDGRRIYTLVTANLNSLTVDHIDVYDAMQVTPGTSALVRLAQLPVTDLALDCGASPAYGCDVRGAFFISPLGDTLFWAGNQRLVVLPLPQAMSGLAAARRLQPAAALSRSR